jgi:hypothetical protein
MEATETRPKQLVAKGTRTQKASGKVKQSVTLKRKTSAKLAAYARWHSRNACDVVEDALAPILAGVRLGLEDDLSGQESTVKESLTPETLPIAQAESAAPLPQRRGRAGQSSPPANRSTAAASSSLPGST